MNMKLISKMGTATAISALMCTASFADVTSEQIWTDLKEQYKTQGMTVVVGSESQDGATLNINDVVMTMPIEEGTDFTISGLSFALEQLNDGTVSITTPETLPVLLTVEDVVMNVEATLKDMKIIASGDATTTTYDFSIPTYGISFTSITAEGETITPNAASVTASDFVGTYTLAKGALNDATSNFDIAALDFDFDMSDPEGGEGSVKLTANIKDLNANSKTMFPADYDPAEMHTALAAGLDTTGSMSHGGLTYDLVVDVEHEGVDAKGSIASGWAKYAMSKTGLTGNWGSTDSQITVVPAMMPLPISVSVAETESEITIPVSKSDTPEDARILTKLIGLSVDDALWGMFDPAAVLPRDPATLIIDLSAKLNLGFDLFDPEAQETALMSDELPAQIHALDINALQLSLVGAEFTGDGAFTFNNDDLETFDGMPAPTGALNLKLVGGNGLLDNLVSMGLIPEDQAMGARMMTGLFANAGEGEDELISTIEVKEDGSVLANGQRIK